MKDNLKIKAVSIDSLEIGSKVYLELEDGTRVWAGGRITDVQSPYQKVNET